GGALRPRRGAAHARHRARGAAAVRPVGAVRRPGAGGAGPLRLAQGCPVSGAGTTERRRSRAVAAFARSPLGRKLSRYTIGSVVATAIGQGAFFVLYAIGVDGSVAA